MKIVDANVLLYAYNNDSPRHAEAKAWLDRALSGAATVGFTWVVNLTFLRLATKPGLQHTSHTSGRQRAVGRLVGPTHRPTPPADAAAPLEHRASIVSYDADFGRFAGVRWEQPRAD